MVVPGSREKFPEAYRDSSRLAYYGSLCNTVEINSTFRKIPRTSTYDKWCTEVPADFQFTLKLLKDFTHEKNLLVQTRNLGTFINAADHVGKKGCLLIQFPASIISDYREQVDQIIGTVQELDVSHSWRKAVEFRSETWYTSETYRMLQQYNSCMVLQDMPKSNNLSVQQRFPFYYYRYHGPMGDYRGSYTETFLQEQAKRMAFLLTAGSDVYAYFNNTMGDAYENAMSLKRLLVKEV